MPDMAAQANNMILDSSGANFKAWKEDIELLLRPCAKDGSPHFHSRRSQRYANREMGSIQSHESDDHQALNFKDVS